MERKDDFQQRRKHLADLSDEQLHQRFWDLLNQVVEPLADLAKTHTSPAIERSVLLRMGFSSLEAKSIVEKCQQYGLLGKGAGNVVLRAATVSGRPYREAGLELAQGNLWPQVEAELSRGC